jgi:hypothetical protein
MNTLTSVTGNANNNNQSTFALNNLAIVPYKKLSEEQKILDSHNTTRSDESGAPITVIANQ